MSLPRVIIIGGGFAGINAALKLKKAPCSVLIIDKTNHHVFQPLLYQVASAALSPGNIATPIREIVRRQANTTVIMADVTAIDLKAKTLTCHDGGHYNYDYLIIAVGANHSYFGHPEWEAHAPGLKNLIDAVSIRGRILTAFELAERADDPEIAQKYLRFAIVGGGPTGVEMAGAVAEIALKTMSKNFRKIKPELSEILLIEGAPELLPSFPKKLAQRSHKDLENMGVTVLTNTMVTDIQTDHIMIKDQDGKVRRLELMNVVWAAGNQASPLLKTLGVPLDRQGRVMVESDQTVPGYRDVFVLGDAAHSVGKDGKPLGGIAPVAIQQGKYVAKLIGAELLGKTDQRKPFRYFDKGMMATIGKAKAVAHVGRFNFSGWIAWLAWCFIHIMYLISYRNRVIVMTQWIFWYITGRRSVRLITRPIEDSPFN